MENGLTDGVVSKERTLVVEYWRFGSSLAPHLASTTMTSSVEELIDESQQALDEEIEEIKQKGTVRVALLNGEFRGSSAGKYEYYFRLDTLATLPDDAPITVTVGERVVAGTIIAVDGADVLLALDEDLGASIPRAILQSAPYFLLELLKKRLDELKSGERKVDTDIPSKLFGFRRFSTARDYEFSPTVPGEDHPLPNEQEREAIALALGSEVGFVWGPPGTGKTTTLAWVVEALFRRGLRVLIAAHTNVATDKALYEAARVLRTEPDFHEGKFVRFGPIHGELARIPEVDIAEIASKRGAAIQKEISKLEEKKLTLERERAKFQEALGVYEQLEQARRDVKELEEAEGALKAAISEKEAELDGLTVEAEVIEQKLLEAQTANALMRFLKGLNVDQLAKRRVQVLARVEPLERAVAESRTRGGGVAEKKSQARAVVKELNIRTRSLAMGGSCLKSPTMIAFSVAR